jgi:hypothetical protein
MSEADVLAEVERALDPARPARSGVEVLGYGEVSAVLAIPSLPAWVCKRMAGFADSAAVGRYLDVVHRYIDLLRGDGVGVVDTRLVPVAIPRRRPVVYLLQPVSTRGFGHALLRVRTTLRSGCTSTPSSRASAGCCARTASAATDAASPSTRSSRTGISARPRARVASHC